MAQFYLLSVVSNLVAGLTLAGDFLGEKMSFLRPFKEVRSKRSAQVAIGITALAVGVIKLFLLSPGEHILILGDLLPALTGMALGIILLAEVNPGRVEQAGESIRKISKTALTYRVPAGITGIVVALLHFLFPGLAVL